MSEWREDPIMATTYARTHPRDKNAPPHWLRCDFVRDGARCVKGEGHDKEHEAPKAVTNP